jgi:nucleotide-binding universal stress UspA family protein
MTRPVVVGVDESATARRAAFRAAEVAAALNAPLHLVMAANRGRADGLATETGHYVDWLAGAEQFLDGLIGELPVATVTRAVVPEDPASAICAEAERVEAQMIVVGNRRVQGISRVLGSIATDVARRASCDVLISDTTSDA